MCTHDEPVQFSHLPAGESRNEIDDFVLEDAQAEGADDPVGVVDCSVGTADCHEEGTSVFYLYHVLVVENFTPARVRKIAMKFELFSESDGIVDLQAT